jgi:hypothetical protein
VVGMELEIEAWAEQNFGACQLGDRRRTKRAVTLAAQVASHPDGSTPTQTERWGDCKAAYRLFDEEDVTFAGLCEPHWQRTRARCGGIWLLIGDTTEVEFSRDVPGLGPTGDGGGRGFFLHSSLMINVEQQPLAGEYKLHLRSRQGQPARTALIEVRFASLRMPVPKQKSPFMKECGISEIAMSVVEVREVDAPEGVEALHWFLLASEPVRTFEAAWNTIGWYEKRPVIEDYHKCLKTGCRVEERQYRKSARLERVTGLLSVVAVRLLQLKFAARAEPDRPADQVVPRPWIRMLNALRKGPRPILTLRDFFRSLAKLGGFLGRKSDGEPGWITIWRGVDKLILCLRGAEAMHGKCG